MNNHSTWGVQGGVGDQLRIVGSWRTFIPRMGFDNPGGQGSVDSVTGVCVIEAHPTPIPPVDGPAHHEADPQAPPVGPVPDPQRPDVEQVLACGPPKERSGLAGGQFVPVEHGLYRPGSRPEGGSPTQGG